MRRYKLIDLIEGFHLSQAVYFLFDIGAIELLKSSTTTSELSATFNLDKDLLGSMLWYISSRSDIIKNMGNEEYGLNQAYFPYEKCGFWLEQYIGTYGLHSEKLSEILRNAQTASSFINMEKHAKAYGKLERSGFPFLAELIEKIGARSFLELGCGAGNLLIDLAKKDPSFFGIGIDANPEMCRAFQKKIKKYSLSNQLFVFKGNAETPSEIIPLKIADSIELIGAISIANGFFASKVDSQDRIINWLHEMKALFPDRRLLVVDYYGRLGSNKEPESPEVLIHDWVQLISGQGVPPPSRCRWEAIYKQAGCTLLDIMEPKKSTIPYFIHLISLSQGM